MNEYYERLNATLAGEFDLFAMEHDDWMEKHIPSGAVIVLQTEDAGFNAWARKLAEQHQRIGTPTPPLVLVHIRELRPPQSRIVRAEAELVTS